MILRKNKGQAALEFLMTYGWAILAAVIVIVVLASFGVFSPSNYVPNKCILSSPLGCEAGTADPNGVKLEIRNGMGETISISNVTVENCVATVNPPVLPYTMVDQNVTVFNVPCTLSSQSGSKFKGKITVTYTKSGTTLAQTSTGDLVDEI